MFGPTVCSTYLAGRLNPGVILALPTRSSCPWARMISEASRMFNIDVNILLGQVDEVQGKGFGTLTILTSCNTDTFSQLLEYLRKHNVTVEEVTSHVL